MRRYDILEKKADELCRLGRTQTNREEEITGEALRLHALICVRDTSDFTPGIEALTKEAPMLKNINPQSYTIVCRTLSSYYQRILSDYSQALHYASENLETARTLADRNIEATALSAIASIYFQKQDTSGWSYALQAYDLSKEIGDLSTRYVTACNMANYLFNNQKFEEAMKYLEEAEQFAIRANLESEKSYLNSFRGDLYCRLGKPAQAEKFYLLSLEDYPNTSNYDKIYSRLCYAIFLVEQKRLNDAMNILGNVSDMAHNYKVTIFEKEIYALISQIYEEKGDFARSLEYYKKYAKTALHLFSEQKEREFAILDLRNKVSEEERKNATQSIEIMKRGRTILILSTAGIIFILILVGGVIYHRRKVTDYKQTISRYLDNMRQERHLREQLEQANTEQRESRQTSGLNNGKSLELYQQLERLMKEDHLYRDSSLSLDKTAGILSTNRTYLSQVVNEKAGKSFSSYVNEYRLNEAVELLSDPDNSEPLKNIGSKVGFTSPSNFYTLFRQRVGVSPSVFRENVKKIDTDIQNYQNDNQN
ncbi:MAG: helix-turn-helix domain-containing protein [Muribaculaceae bacterium]|nr:helix-turn-helix domain-containing protein [Bacteroides sp.]MDE6679938.1 helix-turn-helix domain-containing protein [Muribaculaceae bacterium]